MIQTFLIWISIVVTDTAEEAKENDNTKMSWVSIVAAATAEEEEEKEKQEENDDTKMS